MWYTLSRCNRKIGDGFLIETDDPGCWRAGAGGYVLPFHLYSDAELHGQALTMAARFNLPAAYDAHYLAVAEQVDAAFWTTDRRLANTVGDALPWVHLVSSST